MHGEYAIPVDEENIDGLLSHNDYFSWVAGEAREDDTQNLNVLSFEA